jgi:GTP diphosphokinase / guanosine-3',5'-bis(diphosphate) 3'-diphosphatase
LWCIRDAKYKTPKSCITLIDPMVIRAIEFAAHRHNGQTRKGKRKTPYINHPIKVVNLLIQFHELDKHLLSAAALHDIIEDTVTDKETNEYLVKTIKAHFGHKVLQIVQEVSDDKDLPFDKRKQMQIDHAPFLSKEARKLKIADKICNITDIIEDPPENWSKERKKTYLDWAGKVIEGAKGVNEELETHFIKIRADAYAQIV